MTFMEERPLLVRSDLTVMMEAEHLDAETIKRRLGQFAELVKSPGNVHTYRISPLSLWNAAAKGESCSSVLSLLQRFSKFDLPAAAVEQIELAFDRYGVIRLEGDEHRLFLVFQHQAAMDKLLAYSSIAECVVAEPQSLRCEVHPSGRGAIKRECVRLGYPVHDAAGYRQGEFLAVALRQTTGNGQLFQLRDYQHAAVGAVCSDSGTSGSGVLVLPCGAGKTVIGIAALAELQCATLILTSNMTSVQQWKRELLDKTDLREEMIGEYGGTHRQVRPITIATYQILTARRSRHSEFAHMKLFHERDWGLIMYDEVHLLPAPVFRMTATIQATRRIGLTATLVREDGCEEDVFSLVGPKLYEAPWKTLEEAGWIATAHCTEIRVPFPEAEQRLYNAAAARERFRLAGENSAKTAVLQHVLTRHVSEAVLIIGHYLDQLKRVSEQLAIPMISGSTPQAERERLYALFRCGEIKVLAVSKVANFAVDLPDASVAIQISGSFGSRQEEAQRLGRVLRPKRNGQGASFYTLVTLDSCEQQFALHRQLYLVEQGYRYHLQSAVAACGGALETLQ